MDYKALDKEYIVNVYNRLDAVIDHGIILQSLYIRNSEE